MYGGGQAAIFSTGLGVAMMLAASEAAAGRMSVGDVVMVHGLVFQLTVPLGILAPPHFPPPCTHPSLLAAFFDLRSNIARVPLLAARLHAASLGLGASSGAGWLLPATDRLLMCTTDGVVLVLHERSWTAKLELLCAR